MVKKLVQKFGQRRKKASLRIPKGKEGSNSNEVQTKIQERAYHLFEQRGLAHGHDWDDWIEAERQVMQELLIK